jgi:tetratricopeptide (TPR) repeat protein
LSLDRDDSTAAIREKLHDLKLGWTAKAARAGSLGDHARAKLDLIAQAQPVFEDDAARERYDVSLRRQGATAAADVKIDWLSRAWSYYFVRDDGAAAVAARKAREDAPNDAMAYVVSAWVKIRDGEVKQAKQDADEAFVLDELGEDTADVHHVRGAVYLLMGDFDRAIQGFDRALAKSSEGEKPEILWRKALALEGKRDASKALDCCVTALSPGDALTQTLRHELEQTAARLIVKLCTASSDRKDVVRECEAMRERIGSSRIQAQSKKFLLGIVEHLAIQNPKGSQPGIPLVRIGVTVVSLLLIGVWAGFLLVALVAGAWSGFAIYRRVEWTKNKAAYKEAQAELAKIAPWPFEPSSFHSGR